MLAGEDVQLLPCKLSTIAASAPLEREVERERGTWVAADGALHCCRNAGVEGHRCWSPSFLLWETKTTANVHLVDGLTRMIAGGLSSPPRRTPAIGQQRQATNNGDSSGDGLLSLLFQATNSRAQSGDPPPRPKQRPFSPSSGQQSSGVHRWRSILADSTPPPPSSAGSGGARWRFSLLRATSPFQRQQQA
nr:hypothetical protein Iba_chr15aCG9010 [Ipomoea batatas]